MNEYLTNSQQENLLTLLCFDDEAIKVLRNNIDERYFENAIYRNIVRRSVNYYDKHKEAPKQHISDICEDLLNSDDSGLRELYAGILHDMYASYSQGLNKEYILSELNTFIRRQTLKLGAIEVAKMTQENRLDEAEIAIRGLLKNRINTFDPGIDFHDVNQSMNFFNSFSNYYPLHIRELDVIGICPAPKELFTFVGLSNRGKSWFLVHVGKICSYIHRKKVLHITLEMSKDRVSQRYMQSFHGISKRNGISRIPRFEYDDEEVRIGYEDLVPPLTLEQENVKIDLRARHQKLKKFHLKIKEFPTSQLTVTQLVAYLENLETFYNFIPDIIMVDYPDLMRHEQRLARHDLEVTEIYKELRGIAVEKNCAMIVVSQLRKDGKDRRWLDELFLAEAKAKYDISDNVISFNQTEEEYQHNLARLYVIKGRNDRRGDKIMIAQNYSTGQFCIDSAKMTDSNLDLLELIVD